MREPFSVVPLLPLPLTSWPSGLATSCPTMACRYAPNFGHTPRPKDCVLKSVSDLELEKQGWRMWRLQVQGPLMALFTAFQDLA